MGVEHTNLIWALILLNLPGVLCRVWEVKYQQQHICAVKGSSVVILCSYYYPENGMEVKGVMWGLWHNCYDGPFIFDSKSTNTSTKFQYIGNKSHNCSLIIHHVEHNDKGKYAFRFVTNTKDGKWTSRNCTTLNVVDLNISVTPNGMGTMKEGESVNLTCINGCDGGNHSSAIAWFKNGEPFNEGPVLRLSNMSSQTSGSYACSLKQHTETRSEVKSINVEYGPKNTSVSVRPSTEVDLGSNITLICSSYAKPPVDKYAWFAIEDDKALGQQRELNFICFVPGCAGQYFCSATNIHGSQNSSVVTLKIKGSEATITRNILIIVITAMLLILAMGIVIKRLKNRMKTPKTEPRENTQNEAIYVNWPMTEYNQPQEGGQREGEQLEIIYATVQINTKTKTEQPMDAHNYDDYPVIYSTVFRNQLFDSSCIQPQSLQ